MTQPNAQDILSVMCAPALVVTSAGVVVATNDNACKWLGTSNTASANQPLCELIGTLGESLKDFLQRSQQRGHADCHGYVYNAAHRSQRVSMRCHGQRLQGLQPSHDLLLVFTNESAVNDTHNDDNSGGSICACSEQQTNNFDAVAQCQAQNADAHAMNALSDVALGLVHEVNQPLTAIAAYAHSCRRWLSMGQNDHPKLLPTVDKIIEQVHITGQMINSLKGLVRGHDDERRVCDLNQLVRESLELLALDPRIDRCKIDSQLAVHPCLVVANSVQIKIVLLNLLRNALEASLAFDECESRLCISVNVVDDNWVSATVIDSGAGISAEANEQLFQPFMSSKSSGLGLGLVISRCLAAAHDGRIECQTRLPHGASFQLHLPTST